MQGQVRGRSSLSEVRPLLCTKSGFARFSDMRIETSTGPLPRPLFSRLLKDLR